MNKPPEKIPIDPDQRVNLLRRKRHALALLVAFSKNIAQQGNALNDILVLGLPSQKIPEKIRTELIRAVDALKKFNDKELQKRLSKIDKLVNSGVKWVVTLAQSVDQFEDDRHKVISTVDHIEKMNTEFRKRAELALATRIVLHDRGLTTERLQLKYDQEMIAERLLQIRHEEHECRKIIATHINNIVHECDDLLLSNNMPNHLQKELLEVKRVMLENLEHLKIGRSLDTLPFNFEVIVMDSPEFMISETPIPDEPPEVKTHNSFWAHLKSWLNTPWSVSWKQTEYTSKKNDSGGTY